jgi:LuxR family maltose regulon positive regulatory protein
MGMHTFVPSKLAPPVLPRDLVSRPELRAALDAGAQRALTVVCAPPGFGKTLLLADWVKRSRDIPTAWVSLDEEDVDPRRLWSSVLTALRACPRLPGSSRLHRLLVSRTTVELDFLDDLLQALAELQQPVRVVLDDVHHLHNGPVLEHLRILVRDHGPQLRLVLASRMDPSLPLARMRLNDELSELRVDRMRFSLAESLVLLNRSGISLERRQCVDLHERTGGWVAGLRLAIRSLSSSGDADRFLKAFSGDERSVADYLADEVLAEISDSQRDVLRRTSIADPIPPGLAVELCEREDAADVLDALVHDLGLVTVSDGDRTEYRVQELLRSYLLADMHRHGDDQAELHRRAARWWDRQGRPAEALRHIGRTGDRELIADLIRKRTPELVAKGEHGVLLDIVPVGDGDPEMEGWRSALAAQVNLLSGDREAVSSEVRRARQSGGAPAGSRLAMLLTAIEQLAGVAACPPRVGPLPEDPALAALVLAGRGVAWCASGALADGRADLIAALDGARRLDLPLLEAQCLTLLGGAAWAAGELRKAASLAAAGLAALRGGGWHTTGWAAAARAVGGLAALDRAQPESALDAAETGLRGAGTDLDPVIRFALRVVRGGALFDQGEKAAGLLELQQARAEVGQGPVPVLLAARAALLEHHIALALGYARAAASAAGWLSGRAGAHHERILIRAWFESAEGASQAADATLAPLRDLSKPAAWSGTAVEAWLVTSRLALEDGDRPAARRALRSALDRAMPSDLVRPFGLAAAGVRALLVDELVGGDERSQFAARALGAGRTPGRSTSAVLTARERDVLTLLPSLLNLDEIALDLSVSINTVKSHVRSIYDKLGAGTRRTAVLAAHEQGILR